jgi:hypothetical protein
MDSSSIPGGCVSNEIDSSIKRTLWIKAGWWSEFGRYLGKFYASFRTFDGPNYRNAWFRSTGDVSYQPCRLQYARIRMSHLSTNICPTFDHFECRKQGCQGGLLIKERGGRQCISRHRPVRGSAHCNTVGHPLSNHVHVLDLVRKRAGVCRWHDFTS